MPTEDWLDVPGVELSASQQAVLTELGNMLDLYRPARLDIPASRVARTRDGVVVTLCHADDPSASIDLLIANDQSIVSWLSAHEHIDKTDGTAERPWTTVTVDAVAAILSGAYEVEETRRLGLWTKTRVLDVKGRSAPEPIGTSGPLWGWLLRPFPATVIRRRLDFGVQRSRA